MVDGQALLMERFHLDLDDVDRARRSFVRSCSPLFVIASLGVCACGSSQESKSQASAPSCTPTTTEDDAYRRYESGVLASLARGAIRQPSGVTDAFGGSAEELAQTLADATAQTRSAPVEDSPPGEAFREGLRHFGEQRWGSASLALLFSLQEETSRRTRQLAQYFLALSFSRLAMNRESFFLLADSAVSDDHPKRGEAAIWLRNRYCSSAHNAGLRQ